MLSEEQLADELVSLEDECALGRARCSESPATKGRTRDSTKIHFAMTHATGVLGDIVRQLLEDEPDVKQQPKARLTELLEVEGIILTPRSLGRWPYKEAIESAMAVKLAAPDSREARVRKLYRQLPRRTLVYNIQQKEAERDKLDVKCQEKASAFARLLEPLP